MKNDIFVDFSWIINVITRRKWLFLIPLATSLIASLLIMIILPPSYKASTTLMVEPSKNYQTNELNMLMAGERLALTYTQILKSRPILEEVISQNNSEYSVGELADMITVQPVENTQLIRLSVINRDADLAVEFANSIATTFISYNKNLSNENYNQLITNNQKSSNLKQDEIDRIIADIDTQNKLKTDLEAEKSRQENLLTLDQNSYLILQQNAQSLELTMSESANKVNLVEPAFIERTITQPPYIASSIVFFDLDIITGSADTTTRISDLITQIYSPMLFRENLLNKVINQLGLSESTDTLAQRISYDAIAGTQFLKLSIRNDDPVQAMLIADSLATNYIEQIQNSLAFSYNNKLNNIQSQMDELSSQMDKTQEDINNNAIKIIPVDLEIERLKNVLDSKYADLRSLQTNYAQLNLEVSQAANSVVISEKATHAKSLVQEKVVYSGVLILLAAIFGIGLMFIYEHIDDKVRTKEDLASLLDLISVGNIGHIEEGKDKLIFETNSSPIISEDFRKLSAAIRKPMKEIPLRSLLITSPNPGEGKSIIASNLAISLAKTGVDVILVDADYHHPTMDTLFNLEIQGGLTDYLTSNRTVNHLKETKYEKLRVLTTGEKPDDPSELLSSSKLGHSINTLTLLTKIVLIDCPPILTLADTSFLTPLVDGVILVIRSGVTKRKDALQAATNLKNAGIKYISLVLNDVEQSPDSFNQYYSYDNGIKGLD